MARDIATRKIVDLGGLSDAEVIGKAVERGFPEPPDRLTGEGLLLRSEPGADRIEMSAPDEFGEKGRLQLAEDFLNAHEKAGRKAAAAAVKAALPAKKKAAKPKKAKAKGGGYYELPDGTTVRGQAAVEDAGYAL